MLAMKAEEPKAEKLHTRQHFPELACAPCDLFPAEFGPSVSLLDSGSAADTLHMLCMLIGTLLHTFKYRLAVADVSNIIVGVVFLV